MKTTEIGHSSPDQIEKPVRAGQSPLSRGISQLQKDNAHDGQLHNFVHSIDRRMEELPSKGVRVYQEGQDKYPDRPNAIEIGKQNFQEPIENANRSFLAYVFHE